MFWVLIIRSDIYRQIKNLGQLFKVSVCCCDDKTVLVARVHSRRIDDTSSVPRRRRDPGARDKPLYQCAIRKVTMDEACPGGSPKRSQAAPFVAEEIRQDRP